MNRQKIEALFRYGHLPEHLQKVSKPFHDMALDLVDDFEPNAEVTLAIRKLWEAKNLVVYATVEKGE